MNLPAFLAVLGLGFIARMEHRTTGMLEEQMAQGGYKVQARASESTCDCGLLWSSGISSGFMNGHLLLSRTILGCVRSFPHQDGF